MRDRPGAWRAALKALELTAENGVYPYVIAMTTRDFLRPERFWPFLDFAAESGALEVHLLEPTAAGKLAGRKDVKLNEAENAVILDYQRRVAADDAMPILSSFLHLESPEAFGCGAGLTHIYIDGSGEVCPCNLIPLSFGNIEKESISGILDRMGCHFCKPRTGCVGQTLSSQIPAGQSLPLSPYDSARLCEEHLPAEHPIPRFFQARAEAQKNSGR